MQHHLEKTVIIIILLTGIDGAYIPRVIVIVGSPIGISPNVLRILLNLGSAIVIWDLVMLIHMTTFARDLFLYRYFPVCEEAKNVWLKIPLREEARRKNDIKWAQGSSVKSCRVTLCSVLSGYSEAREATGVRGTDRPDRGWTSTRHDLSHQAQGKGKHFTSNLFSDQFSNFQNRWQFSLVVRE